jgi:hypothetical protein
MFQGNYCLTVGTNLSESISEDQCVCLNKTNENHFNYAGRHCDIPESIWTQNGGNSFFHIEVYYLLNVSIKYFMKHSSLN